VLQEARVRLGLWGGFGQIIRLLMLDGEINLSIFDGDMVMRKYLFIEKYTPVSS
jgi:hypothetical protein